MKGGREEIMTYDKEDFRRSGPGHLLMVDWNDPYHQRSVAACLAKAVKVLEHDRQGEQALASAWWEFFHFKLYKEIKDGNTIFGVIFEYKSEAASNHINLDKAPRYVVAFRGTVLKLDSMFVDLKLDSKILFGKLHDSSRVKIAKDAVDDMVSVAGGASNIWLTGHSLGAAIAMLTGKYMARKNYLLETYLFNPPFPSFPIEIFKDPKVQRAIRLLRDVVKAGVATIVNAISKKPKDDPFVGLYEWTPNLFVNRNDVICSEYIGYFKHWEWMCNIGAEKFQSFAMRNSIRSTIRDVLGKDSEAMHLLPSAKLNINLTPPSNSRQAHRIHLWWRSDTSCECNLY